MLLPVHVALGHRPDVVRRLCQQPIPLLRVRVQGGHVRRVRRRGADGVCRGVMHEVRMRGPWLWPQAWLAFCVGARVRVCVCRVCARCGKEEAAAEGRRECSGASGRGVLPRFTPVALRVVVGFAHSGDTPSHKNTRSGPWAHAIASLACYCATVVRRPHLVR